MRISLFILHWKTFANCCNSLETGAKVLRVNSRRKTLPSNRAIRVSEEFDLDIFVKMHGESIDDFRPNLRFFQSDEVRIAYLSPIDLVLLKAGSWREKARLDVAAMKAILDRESGT